MAEHEEQAIAFARQASLGMPGSIKQVADFLLSEGTGIAQLSMAQIAARAYTSKPTLVRFAKQAGYAGWKDYRHDFLISAAQQEERQAQRAEVDVNDPFGRDITSQEVLEHLLHIQSLAAAEVRRSVSPQVLEEASRTILSAKDVAYFGAMQNLQRGRIFASNLGLIGILCRTPQSDEAAAVAGHLQRGDCLIVASYSGGLTHMPMAFVPKLRERGVCIIAITNSERSPLGELADYTLAFAPLEHLHAKTAAFYSGTCTSLILDALYSQCYVLRFEESSLQRGAILEGLRDFIPRDFAQ